MLTVAPGTEVTVRGAGYPGATLAASWEVTDPAASGGGTWLLRVPDTPGRYQLGLDLWWPEGSASYALLVDVVRR